MKIQFIGATKTVTGSMHYIQINGKNILLDCGLYQGRRADSYEINTKFNFFNPSDIDYVILSHAHIDHSGNIPNLVKNGFRGKIIATNATVDLCKLMLLDSGHIQEKDAEYINKKKKKKEEPLINPLYTSQDAQNSLEFFEGKSYHESFDLDEDIQVTFYNAGHILGSAITQLKIRENGKTSNLSFLGDLGRNNLPIIRDPEIIETPDILISEGTYGNKIHHKTKEVKEVLINATIHALKRNSKIIIPAFSVGRTQQLILLFHEIFDEYNFIIPIFIDSPLSSGITEVYRKHVECYDEETIKYVKTNQDPFKFKTIRFVESVEESKSLNELKSPAIIISASGMCETGRILHHLANNIENPNNIILIVGYNAPHTLGRRIANAEKRVKIFDEEYEVKAKVIVLDSLSAHADQSELLAYFKHFDSKKIKQIFLVHGEEDALNSLKTLLKENQFENIFIPDRGNVFKI